MIDGYSAWDAHVALVHAGAEGNWFVDSQVFGVASL
jgi:hypothetical protein